jgi:hypothetical protein
MRKLGGLSARAFWRYCERLLCLARRPIGIRTLKWGQNSGSVLEGKPVLASVLYPDPGGACPRGLPKPSGTQAATTVARGRVQAGVVYTGFSSPSALDRVPRGKQAAMRAEDAGSAISLGAVDAARGRDRRTPSS